jgi:hypothetical protein
MFLLYPIIELNGKKQNTVRKQKTTETKKTSSIRINLGVPMFLEVVYVTLKKVNTVLHYL